MKESAILLQENVWHIPTVAKISEKRQTIEEKMKKTKEENKTFHQLIRSFHSNELAN